MKHLPVPSTKTTYWLYRLVVLSISVCVIVARRPDAITNPQFWAEDGARWYADAYNQADTPFKPYITPEAGYLQTLSRLIAGVSMLFPLEHGPLILNASSYVVQIIPILIIVFDQRSRTLFTNHIHEFIFILAYLLVPNTSEIHGNITNAQWYLAFASLLTVLKTPSTSRIVHLFDVTLVSLSCVSGPFSLFLLPITIVKYFSERNNVRTPLWITICAFTSIVQLIYIFTSGLSRITPSQSYIFSEFFEIVNKQVIWGAIAGPFGIGWISAKTQHGGILLSIISVLGIGLWVYALIKGSRVLRYISIYALMLFLVSILIPTATVADDTSLWVVLANTNGLRYWLIPMLAFLYMLTSVIWSNRVIYGAKILSVSFLLVMTFFTVRYTKDNKGIHYPAFPDLHYDAYISEFKTNIHLKSITIPIVPKGWYMTLEKRDRVQQ